MTTDPFITFRAAAELRDVSKKAVERFYKKEKTNPEYSDAFEYRADAKGAKYFIRESIALRAEFTKASANRSSFGRGSDEGKDAIREVVNQLKIKDEQLKSQLGKKDEQIANLQQSLQAEQALHMTTMKKRSRNPLLLLFGRGTPEEGIQPISPAIHDESISKPHHVRRLAAVAVLSTLALTLGLIQAFRMILLVFS